MKLVVRLICVFSRISMEIVIQLTIYLFNVLSCNRHQGEVKTCSCLDSLDILMYYTWVYYRRNVLIPIKCFYILSGRGIDSDIIRGTPKQNNE